MSKEHGHSSLQTPNYLQGNVQRFERVRVTLMALAVKPSASESATCIFVVFLSVEGKG